MGIKRCSSGLERRGWLGEGRGRQRWPRGAQSRCSAWGTEPDRLGPIHRAKGRSLTIPNSQAPRMFLKRHDLASGLLGERARGSVMLHSSIDVHRFVRVLTGGGCQPRPQSPFREGSKTMVPKGRNSAAPGLCGVSR